MILLGLVVDDGLANLYGIGVVASLEVPSLANVSTCSLPSMPKCAWIF